MIIDFHIHSNTSSDAKSTITEIYQSAVEKGLEYICITNHDEPATKRYLLTPKMIRLCRREIAGLKKRKGPKILFGAEIGYSERKEKEIREHIRKSGFDFVIGSIHTVRGVQLAEPKNKGKIKKKDLPATYKEYFRLLKKAIKSEMFDVIGHIDLYKKILPDLNFADHRKEWEEIGELMKNHNVGFEINTAYSKYAPEGQPGFYPRPEIIKTLMNKGVNTITIGSDAHKAKSVGRNIPETTQKLKRLGLKKICIFEKRKPRFVRI